MRKVFCKTLTLIFFIVWPAFSRVYSQEGDYFLGAARYSFVKYTEDVLLFPADDTRFSEFLHQLDQLIKTGEGNLNIVHMGGSHIQADIYTHLMRKRFQELTPDMNGGRGLIFPYKIARTNTPSNYGIDYTGNWNYCKSTQSLRTCKLGLTGIAVSTTDSAATILIDPNREQDTRYRFNSVRVFHEPSTYIPKVQADDTAYTGTYNTAGGYTEIDLPEYRETLDLRITRDTLCDSFVLQGISLDSDMPGIVYNAIGVNGSMLRSYIESERYVQHLKAMDPQLVIFSIGTNDAYTRRFDAEGYHSRYRQLLDSTRKAAPHAAMLITVPNDSYLYRKYVNRNTEKMQEIIMNLAMEYSCGVWDFYSIMGGLNSAQAWYSMHLMNYDRIHFNRQGYLLKGELFFSAFLKAWENNRTDESQLSIYEPESESEPFQ